MRQILLLMTPFETPKALQAPGCEELESEALERLRLVQRHAPKCARLGSAGNWRMGTSTIWSTKQLFGPRGLSLHDNGRSSLHINLRTTWFSLNASARNREFNRTSRAQWKKETNPNNSVEKEQRICRCRNSRARCRRNDVARLRLPQQLARKTPQRLEGVFKPLPEQLARRTSQRLRNNDPKSRNMREAARQRRTREEGDNIDRWQHEDDLGSRIFHRSGFRRLPSGRIHQNTYTTLSPCSLHPSGSSERPPWETCEKNLQTPYLQSSCRPDAVDHPVNNGKHETIF